MTVLIRQIQYASYPNQNDACGRGEQFGVQVVGSLVIIAWTVATCGIVLFFTQFTMGLRMDPESEEDGLDASVRNADFSVNKNTSASLINMPVLPIHSTYSASPGPVDPMMSFQLGQSSVDPRFVGPVGLMTQRSPYATRNVL